MSSFHLSFLLHSLARLLAQTTPSPSPTAAPRPDPNLSLLQSQLEFLKDANDRLASSFESFTSTVNTAFVILTAVLGILGAIGLFLYGQTLKEAKQAIEEQVQQAVERSIARSLKRRVDNLETLLDREDIIKLVAVDYWLPIDPHPTHSSPQPPLEYTLLADRGFRMRFRMGSDRYNPRTDLTVVDLANGNFSEADINSFLSRLKDDLSDNAVVVIYVPGNLKAVDQLREKTRYYIPAIVPIRLLGAVTDAASVAYSLRRQP